MKSHLQSKSGGWHTVYKGVSTFSLGPYVRTTAGALKKVATANVQTNECNCPSKNLFLETRGQLDLVSGPHLCVSGLRWL